MGATRYLQLGCPNSWLQDIQEVFAMFCWLINLQGQDNKVARL